MHHYDTDEAVITTTYGNKSHQNLMHSLANANHSTCNYQTRGRMLHQISNFWVVVAIGLKKIQLCLVFSTYFCRVWKSDDTLFPVFEMLH